MTHQRDESGDPDVVEGAAKALAHPADADLALLSAVHLGLRAVSAGTTAHLPWQRPPGAGEEGLASRHHV